ncbi:MAG: TrkH family potassium uptake protein [Clostridiales bacterium]|nr:TrkH family potassium uptake protein [Clostridiales bacterium]
MNFAVIKRTLGWILLFEVVFLLIPAVTAVVYWEKEFFSILITMLLCAAVGGLCLIGKTKNTSLYAKEGFVIVALSWIFMSLFGALPFWLSGAIPSYIDALFETVSGFTTTGATILATGEAVEGMAKSLLMWRSFTHWVGGMGVLVLIMAFLPLSGARNMNLMKAESPGPSVSKLVPKVRTTAIILYAIYSAMTVLQFILLLCGGMPVFDALNTAFATAGTGGFAIRADGFAGYSPYTQVVVTVFMLLFSINFNSYYFLLKGKIKEVFTTEVKVFLGIVFAAILMITLNVLATPSEVYDYNVGEAIRHSAFSVASVISTTGFSTENFDLWPAFSKTMLVILMFIGACAGSTGGGMKVSRFLILYKGVTHDMKRMLHPRQVKKITIDKHVVEHEVVRSVNAYVVAYVFLFVASLLLISLDGQDLVTNFTAVVATINNIGPGLNKVGPAGNFAFFSIPSKLVFIFNMLAGRLELFPMLLLFAPATWRK